MRVVEELPGKVIVDANGNEVGKVDDVEIDLEARSLEALVVPRTTTYYHPTTEPGAPHRSAQT
jgi:sporulation protein YlmC with PRC-barrel domain